MSRTLADLALAIGDRRALPDAAVPRFLAGWWPGSAVLLSVLAPGPTRSLSWLTTALIIRSAYHDTAGEHELARRDFSAALAALHRSVRLSQLRPFKRDRIVGDLMASFAEAADLDRGRILDRVAHRLGEAIKASGQEYLAALLDLFFAVQAVRMDRAGVRGPQPDLDAMDRVVEASRQVRYVLRPWSDHEFRCTMHLIGLLDERFALVENPADRRESAALRWRLTGDGYALVNVAERDDLRLELTGLTGSDAGLGRRLARMPSAHPMRGGQFARSVDRQLSTYQITGDAEVLSAALRLARDGVRGQTERVARSIARLRLSRVLQAQAALWREPAWTADRSLARASRRTLDRAIATAARACADIPADSQHFASGQHVLGDLLYERFRAGTGTPADRARAILCLRRATSGPGLPSVRIAAARILGDIHAAGHDDRPEWDATSVALGYAVRLLGHLATPRFALRDRQRVLEDVQGLSCDAAAAELNRGSPARAVAVLEAGRCVILAQVTSGSRTAAEPPLAPAAGSGPPLAPAVGSGPPLAFAAMTRPAVRTPAPAGATPPVRAPGRGSRRARVSTTVTAMLALVAVLAAAAAFWEHRAAGALRQQVRAQQDAAQSLQLAAEAGALFAEHPDLAALLAVRAYQTSPTTAAARELYNAATLPLRGRLDATGTVRFSPDGRSALAGGALWDVASRRVRTPLANRAHLGSTAPVLAEFSPDGRVLAVTDEWGALILFDASTGARQAILTEPGKAVSAFVFGRDGRTLTTAGPDLTVQVWDLATRQALTSVAAPGGPMFRKWALSPDGRTLATLGGDHVLRVSDASTGQIRFAVPGARDDNQRRRLAFSPDGRTLAEGFPNGKVVLLDTATGATRSVLDNEVPEVHGLTFSPDGQTLVSGAADNAVRLWDVGSGTKVATFAGHGASMDSAAFSPDGRTLITGSAADVRLWDVGAVRPRATLSGHAGAVLQTVFSPDGLTLATAGADGSARLWDTGTGQQRANLAGHKGSVRALAFSPDGQVLATGGEDGTVQLWNVATGQPRLTPAPSGSSGVHSVAFSPDGRTLASSYGADVLLWNTAQSRPLRVISAHGTVTRVVFSPDGQLLATGDAAGGAELWQAGTGRVARLLPGGAGGYFLPTFSSDGTILAVWCGDGATRLFDVQTGQATHVYPGRYPGAVLEFSADLRAVGVAGADHAVRVYDVATARATASLVGHTAAVTSLAFSPDRRTVATGGDDHVVRLWAVEAGELPDPSAAIAAVCRNVGRDLTAEERTVHLPAGQSPAPVC